MFSLNVLWLCEVRNSNCLIINYLPVLRKYKLIFKFKTKPPHLAKPLLCDGFLVYFIFSANLVIFYYFCVLILYFMKYFIFGSIVTFLISVCVYFYITNTSLSATINTYKNNIDKDCQKAKEAYFIQQQSDNTSLILFTVTALFTIFSFFTFASVKRVFDVKVAEIEDKYNEQITKNEESVIHINNLRSALNLQYADKINKKFGEALLKRPLDIPNLIELGLMTCQNYYYAIGYNSYKSEEFSKIVTKHITPILNVMVEKVNTVDTVELVNINYNNFLAIKDSFDLTSDKDNLQKFSTIFSKLSFPTLD